jgi:hypothetical protein
MTLLGKRRKTSTQPKSTSKQESGFVTVEFVLGVAFLMLPVALIALTLPVWSERQAVASVAAREAARTFVLTGNEEAARTSAIGVISNNPGIDADEVTITFEGDPLEPGAEVQSDVTISLPMTLIPLVGDFEPFDLTESHTEVVDLYRSIG